MKIFDEKNVEDLLALTPMQEGMLFHYLKNPENNDYFEQLILEISGKINVEIFEKSWNFVIRTNEMLRTVFRWRQLKKPVQLVLKVHNFKVNYKESEAAQEEPFDLQEVPFRVSLCKIEDTRYRMIVTNHHILYDGWSNHIILEEFFAAYEHLSKGEGLKQPVKTPFKEFIKWLQHQDKQQQGSYWQAYLEGFNPGTRLGEITGGRYWENERQGKGKRVKSIQIRLTGSLRKILEQSAAEYKLTPAVIFYTAWGILLQKCTNCNDVVVGTTVSGRNAPIKGIENMVGLFINTLPFRVQDHGNETIKDMLERLQSALQERSKYESTPVVDIRRYSEGDIDNELFDTLVVVENYPFTLDDRLLPGNNILSIESYNMVEQTHYNLSVGISLFDEVDIRFIYDSSMFSDDIAAALVNRFISIINFILEQPGNSIYEIDILSKEEKQQLLIDFNDTAADFPSEKTLHQLFEEQVERTPVYTALAAGKDGMHLSYGELNKMSDQLVHLLRKRGVHPDTIVGIMMERSIEMVSGMLSILKAGGAYLPIDPGYPQEHIELILKDSNAKILFSAPDLTSATEPSLSTLTSTCRVSPTNPAYIIYTSGSTGAPKGVVVEHCSAVNTVTWFIRNYNLGNNTHILQMSEYTFDPSVNQVFGTLLCGGTLYLISKEQLFDVRFLREFIKDRQIHILNSVPSFLMELLGGGPRLQSVKAVLSGSERLPEPVKDAVISRGYPLYNHYGPTETTIDALSGKCSTGRVTLGKPVANARCYLLNSVGQLVPPCVPGELYIGGAGLARGYLNNPELTAEKFDHDLWDSQDYHVEKKVNQNYKQKFLWEGPGGAVFSKSAPPGRRRQKIYKSGDLARWLSDGNIEYIGRIDQQIKIRGFRIEPGEIENRLLSCPGVKEAVVTDRESKQGDKYLCAYIVGENLVKENLKEYLSGKLPAYMIPAHIVEMEKIPLTANGKIDRAALLQPEYEGRSHDARYAAPVIWTEERLVEVWEKVLGFEGIGIDDNFFQLGGDSIKAIQVSARLLRYGLELKINDLFLHPVIRELGKCVKKRERGRKGFQGIIEEEVPLTPIQHWLFESGFTGIHHFNHSVLLYCKHKKGLDEVILQKVFTKLVEHHDALRMVYGFKDMAIFQECQGLEGKLFDLEVVYVTDDEIEKEIESRARQIQQSIDLTTGPLLRSGLFKTSRGDYLLIVIHHLVVDGVSWRILIEDLVTGYKQLEAGNKLELPEKTDSFHYWARRLAQYGDTESGEVEYWKEVENTEINELPRDHVIEDSQGKQKYTAAIDITLDKEQTERLLKQVNQAYNTEINDILLTALGLAVNQWGEIEKVLVNLEGHGRESIIPGIDISRTVGWFTTQYPVVLDMRKSQDLSYAVRCVKETLRRIPDKGIGYGILKYLTPPEKQHCTFQLKPEISFNYLGHFMQGNDDAFFKLSGINTGGSVHPGMQREHAVDIVGMLSEGKIRFSFLYNKYEYDKDHMESMARGFQSHLLAIIRHCSARKKPTATPYDLGCEISLEELGRITGFAAANIDEDVEIQYIYPLSPMQNGMLYHWLKNQRDNAYFEQVVLKIRGEINRLQLEDSVNRLVERHDILKTLFFYEGLEEPRQIVLKERNLVLYYEDISHLSKDEVRLYLEEFKEKDKKRGFDLTLDMLMRFSLFKTGPGLFRLVWSFHHIIMDGWCLGIIYQELIQIYEELKEKKPANLETVIPYKSYIQWLNKQDKAKGLNYWRRYLEGFEQQTILPRVPLGTLSKDDEYRPGELTLELDNPLVSALSRVSSGYGVTMNTLFQTLWGILLQKYNNTDDVVFGSVVSGRPQEIEGVENMVGLFINTVPARITGLPRERFFQLLKRVQEEALSSRAYEYIPLVDIQSQSPLKGNLIDHIWVFENYPFHELVENTSIKKEHGQGHVLGLDIEVVSSFQQTNYDFNVLVVPRDSNQLAVRFSYNARVYEKEMVNRIGWHFKEIVNRVVDNLGIFTREIEVLTRAERQQILFKFNQLVEFHLEYKTIHGLFMEQVEKSPDRTAVVEEVIRVRPQYLTYRELNKKSNQLVCLLRKKRVQSSTIVGIMIERSIEMVIGMLAILKAGGAYLPIDPTYPEERINYMLADSSARVLLVSPVTEVKIEAEVEVELTAANIISEKSSSPTLTSTSPVRVSPTNPAYIIYTSGSTGVPKGVVVEHCSAVNAVTWFIRNYNLGNNTHIIQISEYTFDPTVYQVFGTLFCGGTLYLIGKEQLFDVRFLREFIKDRQIHILNSVPSFLMELLGGGPRLKSVKAVLSGGERLPESVKDAVISRGYALYNHYGPTETTIDALSGKCSTGSVTLGKPIANARCYVLNRVGQLVPPCVPGEIYIGGAGVARGYLNNPELTAQKFLFKSYNFYRSYMSYKSYVLYKSGDMARWLSDGNIEYIGRIDHQVKIRGFRIEPEEIVKRIETHCHVREAVVIAGEEKNGDKYLVAYLAATDKENLDLSKLRDYLAGQLPPYMVPVHFVLIDRIPLTAAGKVDRQALPGVGPQSNEEYVPPGNALEMQLVEIWADVIGAPKETIGIDANFFKLGGHSLKAIILISRIKKALDVEIRLVNIFEKPTVRELAQYIKHSKKEGHIPLQVVEKREYYSCSAAQRRMYFLQQLDKEGTGYNLPAVMTLVSRQEKEKSISLFRQLIRRHESLRTSFHMLKGEPVQRILEENYKLQIINFKQSTTEKLQTSNIISEFVRPFDLAKAPLMRVGLMKLPHTPAALRVHPSQEGREQEYILMLDMHHIITDGVSSALLLKEFLVLYREKDLMPLKFQYKDYSRWQGRVRQEESFLQSEAFWLEEFFPEPPILSLPYDFPRPQVQSYEGGSVRFELSVPETDALQRLALSQGATMYMVLLATFNILLARLSGQEDIVMGTPVGGRSHADLEGIIGLFVNSLALRNSPQRGKTFKEFLTEVKENTLKAFENQDYPFEELVDNIITRRETGRNPLFDVMISLENIGIGDAFQAAEGILQLSTEYGREHKTAIFDLSLDGFEGDGKLYLDMRYCAKLFKEETIVRFSRYFKEIVSVVSVSTKVKIGEMDILSDEEKQSLLFDFNDTDAKYPADKTVLQLFEEQAEKSPDSAAVIGKGQMTEDRRQTVDNITITYKRLNEKSHQLAYLLKEKGIEPGTFVGLMVERSLEMIMAILGTLKAGGAYLPIDPDYPQERINYMLKDSSASILLATEDTEDTEGVGPPTYYCCMNTPAPQEKSWNNYNVLKHSNTESTSSYSSPFLPFYTSQSSNLAYIIYTSGSTGRPRGVLVEHRNLTAYLWAFDREFCICPQDVMIQQASYAFDAFGEEVYPLLLKGGKIVITEKGDTRDVDRLSYLIILHDANIIDCSPLLLKQLNRRNILEKRKTSPYLFISGADVLKGEYVHNLLKIGTVYNTYGPTEATICTTYYRCEKEMPGGVPIGKPIANYRVYILDAGLVPVPRGAAGELCISGAGVSRGYLNNPELTAERFIFYHEGDEGHEVKKSRIFSSKKFLRGGAGGAVFTKSAPPARRRQKIYKTGDLARWLPDGNIEFFGRIDRQVQLRGFRVELEEIEKRLVSHPQVKEAVVVVKEMSKGNRNLIAYVVFNQGEDFSFSQSRLREFLSQSLPTYMVPSFFIQLEALPLNPAGKIDFQSLPLPGGNIETGIPFEAPTTGIEEELLAIWQEVLGIEKIGINDHFFDLGGNSMSLLNMHEKIEQLYPARVKIVNLFTYNTIASLARFIETGDWSKESGEKVVVKENAVSSKDIAIIGMAIKIKDVETLEGFRRYLQEGVDCIGPLPLARQRDIEVFLKAMNTDMSKVKYLEAGYLEEIDKFDYSFFRLSPREAGVLDPNQRLFLQTAWAAMEDAGYGGDRLKGTHTGVFVGHSREEEGYKKLLSLCPALPGEEMQRIPGNLDSVIPARISYLLDLKGPAVLVNTACSSALTALHQACISLRRGETTMAIAGSVKINLLPLDTGVKSEIASSDGRTRTFDDSSDGTGCGEGVIALLLKPLVRAIEDRDHIAAVIKGGAINQDGASMGITAPNDDAQAEVITRAWQDAGIDPLTISFIEAHGTGTKLGDPIEIQGLTKAFSPYTDKKQFCAVGSVKTNIGHLDHAAGLAGVVKAVLALKHKQIPPLVHFNIPNQQIDFENSPVYINKELVQWRVPGAGIPLRCGVSAFGLSGTNCHVILEEAPPIKKLPVRTVEEDQVLTLSARSPEALNALKEKYKDFLAADIDTELEDICYTANTGRGHYQYRSAFIISSKEELKQKLEIYKSPLVFYNHFKIVPLNKKIKSENEITEAELRRKSEAADRLIDQYHKNKDDKTLKEILRLYVGGADVNWEKFYRKGIYYKVSLPTYPFERKRCWVEPEAGKNKDKEFTAALPGKRLVESAAHEIYSAHLSPQKHWLLGEHRVDGQAMLVGTAYLEMALQACRNIYPGSAVEIQDLVLINPLVVPDNSGREVQTVIHIKGDQLEFKVISRSLEMKSAGWTEHAAGRITQVPASHDNQFSPGEAEISQKLLRGSPDASRGGFLEKNPPGRVDEIKRRCPEVREAVVPDEEHRQEGPVRTGPRWNSLKTIYIGEDECLARLELPGIFSSDLEEYYLYPPLVDTALHVGPVLTDEPYLPLMYRKALIFASTPPCFYAHITRKYLPEAGSETVSFDITLLKTSGEIFARFEDYTLKKVRSPFPADSLYHETIWVPAVVNPGKQSGKEKTGILVLKGKSHRTAEIIKALKKNNHLVIEVIPGKGFAKIHDTVYTIDGSEGDFFKLIETVNLEENNIRQILHLGTLTGEAHSEIETPAQLEQVLQWGVYSLFYLVKALVRSRVPGFGLEILLVGETVFQVTGDEAVPRPENALLFGLAKVVPQEYPHLRCRCLDIDEQTSIETVVREIETKTGQGWFHKAYRRDLCFVEEFRTLDIRQLPDAGIKIKEKGVYMITGGLGGMGLELSKYLAEQARVKLVLLDLYENKNQTGKTGELEAIEKSGSEILYSNVDAADMAGMEEVISLVQGQFGPIAGIIHCAGLPGDGFLINKDEKTFKEVLRPKVQGTWVLDRLTAACNPDFLVLCSSLTALTGAPGQGDYTAANCYLDVFSFYRNAMGRKTLTINWTAWKEVGMAAAFGPVKEEDIFVPISPGDAVQAFHQVLHKKTSRVFIGGLDLRRLDADIFGSLPFKISPMLRRGMEKQTERTGGASDTGPANREISYETVILKGKGEARENYSETEINIASIWSYALGVKEIDIYDNFYDMGGDSIIALTIVNHINRDWEPALLWRISSII